MSPNPARKIVGPRVFAVSRRLRVKTMTKREITSTVREWLTRELTHWQSAGVVSSDQARRILGLYETPAQSSERKQSSSTLALMGLAALMIGLAAFLLIG